MAGCVAPDVLDPSVAAMLSRLQAPVGGFLGMTSSGIAHSVLQPVLELSTWHLSPHLQPGTEPMQINPYLNFNGTCAEAFRFYEQVLGGKITMMQTHGESPMRDQVPPDWHDAVMHVSLAV